MATIVDGRKIASAILTDLKPMVETIKKQGGVALAVVMVGDDKPSQTYVKKKGESAQEIGAGFFKFPYPANIKKEDLIKEIKKIQAENKLSGLIIQLPLPEALRPFTREIVNQINQNIDVDCLTDESLGKVLMGTNILVPPTPGAMLEILKFHQIDLTGKSVVIIGKGNLIGRPLTALLLHQPVNFIVLGKECSDLSVYTKTADIIFTGVGKNGILNGQMIKKGAIVIDAGVSFMGQKMLGDIDFESVKEKAELVTPTPGGVGPITVAKLLENTVISAEKSRI